jgi:hypothetical protein
MDSRENVNSCCLERARRFRPSAQRGACVLAAVLLWALSGAAQAGSKFTPRVTAEGTYTDNIRLDAAAEAQSETVLHLAPGFAFVQTGPRLNATVNYELSGYFYNNSSDSNETVNTLDAAATGTLVPDLFYLDLLGRAGRTVVDPLEPIATGDYYTGANFTDVALWRATPRLVHEFGGDVKALLQYDYGTIYYTKDLAGGAQLPNLTTRNALFSLDHTAKPGAFGWTAKVERQEAQYQGLQSAIYSDAEATAELPLGQRFWFLAMAGSESDLDKSITDGKFDSFYWEGGFRWIVTPNQQLRITAGRRFYGDSFNGEYSLNGRHIKAGLAYTEAPAAQGIELYVNQIFHDDPAQPLPGYTPQGQQIYLRKSATGWATLAGARNDLTLQVLDDRRDYITALGSEHTQRATLGWRYRLGPRTEVHAGVGLIRLGYREQDRRDDLFNVGLGFTRRLGRFLKLSADYRYWKRDVNGALIGGPVAVGFTENAFTLGLRYGR